MVNYFTACSILKKIAALKISKGDYSSKMKLNHDVLNDLDWWIHNLDKTYKDIEPSPPDWTLQSDASPQAWGGVFGDISTGGNWSDTESTYHINYLELLAAFLTLKTFCADLQKVHIHMYIDNYTAVSYINKQGGTKRTCFMLK